MRKRKLYGELEHLRLLIKSNKERITELENKMVEHDIEIYGGSKQNAKFVSTLKKRREALDMSAEEAASKIGVHVTTYRMWERMATEPNSENMRRLKALFLK